MTAAAQTPSARPSSSATTEVVDSTNKHSYPAFGGYSDSIIPSLCSFSIMASRINFDLLGTCSVRTSFNQLGSFRVIGFSPCFIPSSDFLPAFFFSVHRVKSFIIAIFSRKSNRSKINWVLPNPL